MFNKKFVLVLLLSRQERALMQWQGVVNFVGMMYGYPDVVQAIEKFDEARVLGLAPFKESTGDVQYKYCKEFMEWLTGPLATKVTVSAVNRKLKELRQLHGQRP